MKHGKVNATLPKDRDPEQMTLDEAVELIAARERQGRTEAKKPAKKAAKPRARRAKPQEGEERAKRPSRRRRAEAPVSSSRQHASSERAKIARGKAKAASANETAGKLPSKQEILDFLAGRERARRASARSRAPSASRAATASL